MTSRCNICLDPKCEEPGQEKAACNCDTCANKDKCPRFAGIKPTIRITRKCTQACSHCCFECDKDSSEMMTLEKSREINLFCRTNGIVVCEVMGGEFFMNPKWAEIIPVLAAGMKRVRLISNGDWAGNKTLAEKVTKVLAGLPQIHVGISRDKWHTNQFVDKACQYLKDAGIPFRTPKPEEVTDDTIVPVGRAQYDCFNMLSMFSTYCHNEEKKYNLLIDEEGRIYKCGFGTWHYANTCDYLKGGFDARFKEFNLKFYSAFVSNCSSCQRMDARAKSEGKSCCKRPA